MTWKLILNLSVSLPKGIVIDFEKFSATFKKIKFFEFDSFVIRNEEEASLYLDRRDAKVTPPSGDRYYLSWNQRDGFKDT